MAKAKKLDAVFEGGGVKGTAHVGAVAVCERRGYRFERVAGVSAGAIVAALIAAGYTAQEMKSILDDLDYRMFLDGGLFGRLPGIGPLGRLLFCDGIYKGDWFEAWISDLLAYKGVVTFRDLIADEGEYPDSPRRWKLSVIAADITRGRMLVLPGDIAGYGMRPDSLDVASAVRMSMSIPFFFKPVVLRHFAAGAGEETPGPACYIVDGGVLSNFPVWLFDDPNPKWPTIGFKLVEPAEGKPHKITGPVSMLTALFNTMLDAHDQRHVEDADWVRTIGIPTLGVGTVDFGIPAEQKNALYWSGVTAAEMFFQEFSFRKYRARRKKGEIASSLRSSQ